MDLDLNKPSLTEPGVKYFLNETLKNIKKEKQGFNNIVFNVSLLLFFLVILGLILTYKFKNRPDEETRKKKEQLKKDYFITKVRTLQAKKAKQLSQSITNLPKFETPFEILHKNFYNT